MRLDMVRSLMPLTADGTCVFSIGARGVGDCADGGEAWWDLGWGEDAVDGGETLAETTLAGVARFLWSGNLLLLLLGERWGGVDAGVVS